MAEFQVRSDAVDVEHIMRQIRQRIREKRGVDYTEDELRALANVKLEKFLDPAGVRSDLVQQFREAHPPEADPPNFAFEDTTLYETHRGVLRTLRRLLNPVLKLFFNPAPIVDALHIQAELNARTAAFQARQRALEHLRYEVMHNLVVELTRTTIEVRNLKMRLDSMAGRLDFDERRQRAFEGVVQHRRPGPRQDRPSEAPAEADGNAGSEGEDGPQRSKRRRRRRRKVPGPGMPSGDRAAQAEGGDSGGSAPERAATSRTETPGGGEGSSE